MLIVILLKLAHFTFLDREPTAALALSILIFIAVDALFAFPMENAYPFYVAAVLMGAVFTHVQTGGCPLRPRKFWTRISLVAVALTVGYFSLMFGVSKIVEANWADDYAMTAFACNRFPSNWRTCIHKARFELKDGKIETAATTLREVLRFRENHFLALRFLSYAQFELGHPIEGCRALEKYDTIFGRASSLHSGYLKLCNPSHP